VKNSRKDTGRSSVEEKGGKKKEKDGGGCAGYQANIKFEKEVKRANSRKKPQGTSKKRKTRETKMQLLDVKHTKAALQSQKTRE